MRSPVSSLPCAALCCALFSLSVHAQVEPLTPLQELDPTDAEVFPAPDEIVPVGFGTDIAIEGRRALITLPEADKSAGRVAIFWKNPAGTWQRTGQLRFESRPNGVSAVELRGNVAVVASDDTLYVFRSAQSGAWQQGQTFKVDAGESIFDVKYDGVTAVVGTRFGPKGDAAYIFDINLTTAARKQKLLAPTKVRTDEFGTSVAVSGKTVVIGAPGFNRNRGAAYVYQRRGTTWVALQTLLANGGKADDRFGASVSAGVNLIAVGAPGANPEYGGEFGELQRSGTAYVFAPTNGTWAQTQKVRPSDSGVELFTSFGTHIESDSHHVVIGAPGLQGLTFDGGAMFVYERHGTRIGAPRQALDSNALGYAFAIYGNTVMSGIVEPTFYTGRAMVYDLSVRE